MRGGAQESGSLFLREMDFPAGEVDEVDEVDERGQVRAGKVRSGKGRLGQGREG
jgi:hypothetical protein